MCKELSLIQSSIHSSCFARKTLFVLLLVSLFFASRAPFFLSGWDGQDGNGNDTDILINHPPKPNYLLIARIDGLNQYVSPWGHPGLQYEMVARTGDFFRLFLNFNAMSKRRIVFSAKVVGSLFQLTVFVLLSILAFRKDESPFGRRSLPASISVLVLSISPIALYSSNEFQIDSTLGFFAVGLYVLSVYLALQGRSLSLGKIVSVLAASLFIGFGKNEWSFLLILSCFFCFLVRCYSRRSAPRDLGGFYKVLLMSIAGCLVGNLLNYLFNPELYISGFYLMTYMSKVNSIVGSAGLGEWLAVARMRLYFLTTPLIVMLFLFLAGRRALINSIHFLPLVYASLLFFSFFFSSWGVFSRYFAPSFIVFAISLTMFCQKELHGKLHYLLWPVLLVTLVQSCWMIDKQVNGLSQVIVAPSTVASGGDQCIKLMDVAETIGGEKMDFIHLHMGVEGANKIAKAKGKTVCK